MFQCMTPARAAEGSVPPCFGCSFYELLSTVIIPHLSMQYILAETVMAVSYDATHA